MTHHVSSIEPLGDNGEVNLISETPKGSRIKFKHDPKSGIFELGSFLPLGAVFPFDFGFIPRTRGADGDPLDLLVLMDEPAFPGCLVKTRLIGAIEAEQAEGGKMFRNDRLIGVASASRLHTGIRSLEDLNAGLLEEIEHFFISYDTVRGKRFIPLGRHGPDRAMELVEEGIRMFAGREGR